MLRRTLVRTLVKDDLLPVVSGGSAKSVLEIDGDDWVSVCFNLSPAGGGRGQRGGGGDPPTTRRVLK